MAGVDSGGGRSLTQLIQTLDCQCSCREAPPIYALAIPDGQDLPESSKAVTISVVLPTRNERGVIRACVQRLESALESLQAELIFVDDSDDGTDGLIASLETTFPLTLIHRQPWQRAGGLATAVQSGMRAARGDFICVMDADLQHPPEKIADLLAAADAGADVVVASRYLGGGNAGGLGSRSRRAASATCRRIAKLLFASRLAGVTDPMSGFFVVRRQVLDEARLSPIGFKILLEILVRCPWTRLAEVPYRFERRQAGASKATPKQGALFLLHLSRLLAGSLPGWLPFSRSRNLQPLSTTGVREID